ncbi:T9SS type A sorting domain-containing protein [Mucilaginibacter sp. BJC16-A38]|uniref:T9SS type A sorting domain-containing protein n=1 Tax=Mucilaginibacter phenanthrenivorans TaxID=1234842 RepID=UPI0021574D8D|nr:T9SS type A sorting domain-containing protein [Mucilaginibacter phenanthrenivorans]MCR8558269.1 T9SS type A sorting domain-containing protein [Mucilaginibacter phenanthrenivorans]
MRRNSTYKKQWIIIIAIAIFMNFAFSDAMSFQKTDTSILHLLKPRASKTPTFKSTLHLVLPPIKPAVISTTKLSVVKSDDKLLSNVQVYPNPVTDQINLKYAISRSSGVTIKIMDVLGNDIFTLFNQRVEPGQQAFSYSITNKLNQGFYFVRIVAGTESVIKRISVIPN